VRSERGTWTELFVAAGCAALVWAACGTIDPGPPTGPPMGCNGSPTFFLTDVWPKYLDKYTCGKSDCHDYNAGKSSFRLKNLTDKNECPPPVDGMPYPTPMPTDAPANWPECWQFNYVNATRQLNCADPLSSRLLIKPEQRGTSHQGGSLVTGQDATDAEMLFATWARP
jgi:hypothetical protein